MKNSKVVARSFPTEVNKETAIKIEGLRKVFAKKNEEVEAIKGIDLDIKEGDFVSIVGPSGCGKSTFCI